MRWIREKRWDAFEVVFVRWLGLGQISLGLAEGIGIILIAAVFVTPLAFWVPLPSAELLAHTADIGVVLVLAYVLEAAWLTTRFSMEDDYEFRLGAITGLGIAGMSGVVLALLLSAHRAAGHANFVDELGLAWIIPSLVTLAGAVVAQPLLVHEWEGPGGKERSSSRTRAD